VWKCEVEASPFIHLGFSPDSPAVSLNNALGDGQSDSHALELASWMKSLKDSEEPRCILHVKTHSVVSAFGWRLVCEIAIAMRNNQSTILVVDDMTSI
jgi:hypothetical protein